MSQPQFTWWPWKLLALAVPVMATIGLGMALTQTPGDLWKAQLVFWGVWGGVWGAFFAPQQF